ncbi:MAG: sigma-70 family RNA polymerase sigma factor [Myxococcales bacterium]|nr:sigma-70 family RNA polymerase sigma factor [Myxococcales bacterium]
MDDASLLAAWQDGDNAAGRHLVERYYAPIYRFFFSKVRDGACEDLVQETFEVLIRRRGEYRGEGSMRAYLYGIARYVLIGHVRRRRRRRERFEPAEHSVADPASAGLSSIVADRELEKIVADALRSLPLDDQIAIELKDWEGATQAELAALFSVPRPTMARRLQRARARLRRAIDARLASPALRAELDQGLETCMRSIFGKIEGRLGRGAS